MADVTRPGSVIGASGTKVTPSGKSLSGRGRHAQRQPGLADAAGTGQGQERNILTQRAARAPRPAPAPAQ